MKLQSTLTLNKPKIILLILDLKEKMSKNTLNHCKRQMPKSDNWSFKSGKI